jgi:cytochrome c
MNAHPQLTAEDARQIVRYIFSLTDKGKTARAIPLQGKLALTYNEKEPKGQHVIVAAYTDKGANGVDSLTGEAVITLRNQQVRAVFADALHGFPRFRDNLSEGPHKSYVLLKDVDLTHVTGFRYRYASGAATGHVEVRLDSRAGPVVSSTAYPATGGMDTFGTISGKLDKPVSGRHDVYFIAVKPLPPNEGVIKWGEIGIEPDAMPPASAARNVPIIKRPH